MSEQAIPWLNQHMGAASSFNVHEWVEHRFPALAKYTPSQDQLLEQVGTAAKTAGAFLMGLSIVPWLAFARDQLGHSGAAFWVEPLGPRSLAGVAMQFFTGPPVLDGVPGLYGLWALQGIAIAGGALAPAVVVARRRELSGETRRAALFTAGVAVTGIALLAAASLIRSVFEARYASVLWPPLFALAGLGVARAPRALGVAILCSLAVPALALSVAIRNPQTASLLPGLEERVAPNDLVAASPNQYLDVLAGAGPRVRDRLHVVGSAPPWYFGTAAYPPGAVLPAVPPDVPASRAVVWFVGLPDDEPPAMPGGYREIGRDCAIRVCVTAFGPASARTP